MTDKDSFMVFSGTATRYLAEKICASLGCKLGNLQITKFSDGEFAVSYEESIRGRDVFLVQSTFPSSDNLMELLLMIDAAKRASARQIIAVMPYFGWARQDRKDKPRVSIGAKLVADLLSVAGIDRLITMDLHADQIQGFFDVPVDHLYGSGVILPYIENLKLENLVIASPDVGGAKPMTALPSRKKSSFWQSITGNMSSLKYRNSCERPGILCMNISMVVLLKVGRNSSGIISL
jgi:ribose-phosphate pyrophosphokinase